jgi:hypothetical protein
MQLHLASIFMAFALAHSCQHRATTKPFEPGQTLGQGSVKEPSKDKKSSVAPPPANRAFPSSVAAFNLVDVIPPCGLTPPTGLVHEVFLTNGYSGSPANAAQFQTLVNTYATPANLQGSAVVMNVSGNGNPFSVPQDNFLTVISGYIYAPTDGNYIFATDGDDAVEILINGTPLTGYYGLHGASNGPVNPTSVFLDTGFHEIEFRHHEYTGRDSYDLYIQGPNDVSLEIAPGSMFFNCTEDFAANLPQLSPSQLACPTPDPRLFGRTWDKSGFGHPNNATQYQTLVDNYAVPANLFGSGTFANINGSGNPFGTNSNYLFIFTGYFYAPTAGIYSFGVDGDDAIEFWINDSIVSTFYGGHGSAGSAQDVASLNLTQPGYYKIEFRHEEVSGGDNYFLYSQAPGAGNIAIAPASSLFHCPVQPFVAITKTSQLVSDPVNGTSYPKRIPGSVIDYNLAIENFGEGNPDNDSLSIIDTFDSTLEFFVGNLDGSGSPVQFTDGTGVNTSGVSFSFLGLTSTSDSLAFSNNGGASFNYSPSDPDGDGYDPAIDAIDIKTIGLFNPSSGANTPVFDIRFRVRVR